MTSLQEWPRVNVLLQHKHAAWLHFTNLRTLSELVQTNSGWTSWPCSTESGVLAGGSHEPRFIFDQLADGVHRQPQQIEVSSCVWTAAAERNWASWGAEDAPSLFRLFLSRWRLQTLLWCGICLTKSRHRVPHSVFSSLCFCGRLDVPDYWFNPKDITSSASFIEFIMFSETWRPAAVCLLVVTFRFTQTSEHFGVKVKLMCVQICEFNAVLLEGNIKHFVKHWWELLLSYLEVKSVQNESMNVQLLNKHPQSVDCSLVQQNGFDHLW